MPGTEVMDAITIKLTIAESAKKISHAVLATSRSLIRKWVKLQMKVILFPVCFIIKGLKLVCQRNAVVEVPLEPTSKEVVDNVKALRNSALNILKPRIPKTHESAVVKLHAYDPQEGTSSSIKSSVVGRQKRRHSVADSVHSSSVHEIEYATKETGRIGFESETSKKSTGPEKRRYKKVAYLNVSDFTGRNIMWDIPILAEKAKYARKCVLQSDPQKIAAAMKAIEEYPTIVPPPRTKREYELLLEDAKNGFEIMKTEISMSGGDKVTDSETKNEKPGANILQKNENVKKVDFHFDGELTNCSERTSKRQEQPKLGTQNKILQRRLYRNEKKLEDVSKTCASLAKEIASVHEHFQNFITADTKMTDLQRELSERKKTLMEVEAERNEMRCKLLALEKLIKEEEEYLEASCESGIEIGENGDSPDEL